MVLIGGLGSDRVVVDFGFGHEFTSLLGWGRGLFSSPVFLRYDLDG